MQRKRYALVLTTALIASALPVSAAPGTQLTPVRGTVSYRLGDVAPVVVTKTTTIPADATVITAAKSNASIVLSDTTEIALGAGSEAQIGALGSDTTPTMVTLNGGYLRFNVKHPTAARSNYVIKTPHASIAVHGTIGLVATGPVGDDIVCLTCEENDVVVTIGTQTFPVKTSQRLKVAAGVLPLLEGVGPATLQPFAVAGLNTSAASSVGIASAAAGSQVSGGALAAGIAGAGAVIGVTAAGSSTASVPGNGSTGVNGNLGLSSVARPTPSPTPTPTPAPAHKGHQP